MNAQAGAAEWLFDDAVAPNAKLKKGNSVVFDRAERELRRAGIIVNAACDLQQKNYARLGSASVSVRWLTGQTPAIVPALGSGRS